MRVVETCANLTLAECEPGQEPACLEPPDRGPVEPQACRNPVWVWLHCCLSAESRLACALACPERETDGEPQSPMRLGDSAELSRETLRVGLMQASIVVFAGQLTERVEVVGVHRSPLKSEWVGFGVRIRNRRRDALRASIRMLCLGQHMGTLR